MYARPRLRPAPNPRARPHVHAPTLQHQIPTGGTPVADAVHTRLLPHQNHTAHADVDDALGRDPAHRDPSWRRQRGPAQSSPHHGRTARADGNGTLAPVLTHVQPLTAQADSNSTPSRTAPSLRRTAPRYRLTPSTESPRARAPSRPRAPPRTRAPSPPHSPAPTDTVPLLLRNPCPRASHSSAPRTSIHSPSLRPLGHTFTRSLHRHHSRQIVPPPRRILTPDHQPKPSPHPLRRPSPAPHPHPSPRTALPKPNPRAPQPRGLTPPAPPTGTPRPAPSRSVPASAASRAGTPHVPPACGRSPPSWCARPR